MTAAVGKNSGNGVLQIHGKRGVVENDFQFALVIFFEGPGFIDFRDLPVFIREPHFAHGYCKIATDIHAGVFNFAGTPTLEGKTIIIGKMAVVSDEVSQGPLLGVAKCLGRHSERRLEKNLANVVAIGAVQHSLGGLRGFLNASGFIILRDLNKRIAPSLLGFLHLLDVDIVIHIGGLFCWQNSGNKDQKSKC